MRKEIVCVYVGTYHLRLTPSSHTYIDIIMSPISRFLKTETEKLPKAIFHPMF